MGSFPHVRKHKAAALNHVCICSWLLSMRSESEFVLLGQSSTYSVQWMDGCEHMNNIDTLGQNLTSLDLLSTRVTSWQFSISASCLQVSSLPRQLQLFVSQTVPSDTWGNKNMRARDDERNIFVKGLFYNRDNKWCVQIPTSFQ